MLIKIRKMMDKNIKKGVARAVNSQTHPIFDGTLAYFDDVGGRYALKLMAELPILMIVPIHTDFLMSKCWILMCELRKLVANLRVLPADSRTYLNGGESKERKMKKLPGNGRYK